MIRHYWEANGSGFFLTDPPDDIPAAVEVRLLNDGLEGLGNPPHASFTRETALLDGQSNSGWKARPREVFWPILIDAQPETWDDVQSRFWATMRPNLYGTWRVTNGESVRYLTCRYLSDGGASYRVDPSRSGAEVHGLTLIADDPWWHGDDVSATFQTAEDEVDFFNGGTAPDFYIMSGNTVDSVTLDNPGDVGAWATYRIDGPATRFEISQGGGLSMPVPVLAAEIDVLDGEWLVIDTNPSAQTMLHYTGINDYIDVTTELTNYSPAPIETGTDTTFDVVLFGEGSLTVTITPNYYRAF